MPLARIITDSVDDSLELTIQLRARGFQVETVAPGEIPNTPADLEVRLEECAPEDVLTQAAQTSELDDLWVFVAPGALDDKVRPIREILLEPMTVRAPEPKVVAPPLKAESPAAPVLQFHIPEDDPILAELEELKASTVLGAHAQVRAAEPSVEKAEVVVFPTAPEPRAIARPVESVPLGETEPAPVPATAGEREPGSSADMRFWRIATVAAGLAISALLLGASMSRQPNAAPTPLLSATTTVLPVPSPSPRHARSAPVQARRASPTPTQPPIQAKAVAPARSRAPRVAKATRTSGTKLRHRPSASRSDSIIAEDTVVFYDRKPSLPAAKARPEPGLKQSGRK